MHHIVHCIDCVSFSVAGICSLKIDVIRRWVRWHWWRDIISSEVPGKQYPFVHSNTISLSRFCSLYYIRTTMIQLLHAAVVEPLSSAWPVIATVNRLNPLVWVGVDWALMCLLIHACLSCLLLLRVVSGLIHRGWVGMVMNMSYCVWAKCVNTIW